MSLEQRGGRAYYYHRRREGGRVVATYGGAGLAAQLAALQAEADREQRAEAAALVRKARARAQQRASEARAADRALDQIAALAAALVLLAAGFHQHRRMWRRRRPLARRREDHPMQALSEQLRQRAAAELAQRQRITRAAIPVAGLPVELGAAIERCNRPDAAAGDVAALRQQIAAHSDLLAQQLGAPLRQAAAAAVQQAPTPAAREVGAALVERRRVELGYDAAPALERGLIDHLVACEVRLQAAERQHTSDPDPALDAAQRRYLRSVEALARARRVTVAAARYTAPDGGRVEAVAVEGPGR